MEIRSCNLWLPAQKGLGYRPFVWIYNLTYIVCHVYFFLCFTAFLYVEPFVNLMNIICKMLLYHLILFLSIS